ncbi:MAG: hypothetical protein AAB404_01065 [Patescibacteria group bacterium]
MRDRKVFLSVIAFFVFALGWSLNKAFSYYDPPKKIEWVEYVVPENIYLSELVSDLELSNQFKKHPSIIMRIICEENNLNDYFLWGGATILIPFTP